METEIPRGSIFKPKSIFAIGANFGLEKTLNSLRKKERPSSMLSEKRETMDKTSDRVRDSPTTTATVETNHNPN